MVSRIDGISGIYGIVVVRIGGTTGGIMSWSILRMDGMSILRMDRRSILRMDGRSILRMDGILRMDARSILRMDARSILRMDGIGSGMIGGIMHWTPSILRKDQRIDGIEEWVIF
jgi:hypothetical protein